MDLETDHIRSADEVHIVVHPIVAVIIIIVIASPDTVHDPRCGRCGRRTQGGGVIGVRYGTGGSRGG